MISRRAFLRHVALAGAGLGLAGPRSLLAGPGLASAKTITLMHTNDTHARIDPFPQGAGLYAGLGGVARRAALIRRIRQENPHSLLLDAGDVFQGTPYFNFYHGALDYRLMSMMGYDASTLGNHEFDNKVQGFVNVAPEANFPILSSNFDFSGAPAMGALTRPYLIRVVDGIRIGFFGLCIDFEGLVLPPLHEGVTYLDPATTAENMVNFLRGPGACSLVICLSHLGYINPSGQFGDRDLAHAVPDIDIIIGGHTHTLMPEPEIIELPGKSPTLISQVGHAGVVLGRLDITFDRRHRIHRIASANQPVQPLA
ncbi:MAG TPA: metallophosphoesterase [Kiritimatiellia bacterium]|nr:metallophosphoesterase [Kiritimatiellia bacterium]